MSRNNVYIVWMDDSGSDFAESKILYRTSANGGTAFSPVLTNLPDEPGGGFFSSSPDIAVSSFR